MLENKAPYENSLMKTFKELRKSILGETNLIFKSQQIKKNIYYSNQMPFSCCTWQYLEEMLACLYRIKQMFYSNPDLIS